MGEARDGDARDGEAETAGKSDVVSPHKLTEVTDENESRMDDGTGGSGNSWLFDCNVEVRGRGGGGGDCRRREGRGVDIFPRWKTLRLCWNDRSRVCRQ